MSTSGEMAAVRSTAELPLELLIEILSRLSWRHLLSVRRVSRRWLTAADAALCRCSELDIDRADYLRGLNTEMLESLMQKMPALKRLSVDGRSSGEKELHVDLVSHHCRHLEELRLVSVLTDAPTLERLCDSCPRLQAVSMDCSLDETGVETLLRRLPGLRALHLDGTRAVGGCLSLLPAKLQKLTLPNAIHLQPACFSHLARCSQLRDLDLSRTKVRSADLAAVLSVCLLLERLNVASCPELDLTWVPQLFHRPKLRELRISHLAIGRRFNPDLVTVLATCGQIERLAISCIPKPRLYLAAENISGITHLDLSGTSISDVGLSRLHVRLPALSHLNLFSCRRLTAGGLASVLPPLRHLQVLDMRGSSATCSATVLDSLNGMPSLRMLSCGRFMEKRFTDRQLSGATVAGLVLSCPELTLFQPVTNRDVLRDAVQLLAESLPPHRDVTLIVEPGSELTTQGGLRVMGDSAGLWDDLVDWHWPRRWG